MNTKPVEYFWKMKGFFKGINPNEAIVELQRIQKEYGELTPKTVLEASRNPDALFHKYFEWDDTKAAEAHRLQQARILLNNVEIRVVSSGKDVVIPVFEHVKTEEKNTYKTFMSFDTEDVSYLKDRTRKEIEILVVKLSKFEQFNKIVNMLEEVLNELDCV
jgi:hypothetical protein